MTSSTFSLSTPILYLIFNRPKLTGRTFEAIRKVKPQRLYIAGDGPRTGKGPAEQNLVRETRELVLQKIDWPCDVKTLFRDNNLGCGRAVSEAISWFFEQEEMGIILEDDCLPDLSFFRFCEELLIYHKDNGKIGHIGGINYLGNRVNLRESYYYSNLNQIWGWATWRRAWKNYDHKMTHWPEWKSHKMVKNFSPNSSSARFWNYYFEETFKGNIDSWGFKWTFATWKNGLWSILPKTNLVQNIGFGIDATHTKNKQKINQADKFYSIKFPLIHPEGAQIDTKADASVMKKYFSLQFSARRIIRSFLKYKQ